MWSIMYKVQMFHCSVIWFPVVYHLQNSDVLSCSVFTVFTVSLCHCVHCSYDCLVCGVFMYKIQMFYRVQVSEVFCVHCVHCVHCSDECVMCIQMFSGE